MLPSTANIGEAQLRAPNEKGITGALYSFATVVDEIDFGITHVIRAEEHLANTPVQMLIFNALVYHALGKKPPEFAHIPLVYYNGKKMAKRDLPPLTENEIASLQACGWAYDEIKCRDDLNIATVAYYRALGYLPQALVNYLLRLGWSLNDTDEFIPLDVAIKNFSLERVTKAPGNFDTKKLMWLQTEYMKLLSPAEKLEKALPYMRRAKLVGDPVDPATHALLLKITEMSGERIKLLSDLVFYAAPLLKESIEYRPQLLAERLTKAGGPDRLRGFAEVLRTAEPFDPPTILAAFMGYATAQNMKPKDLDGALRVALTGETVGFGLPETLSLLGRDKALARIEAALKVA